MKTFALYLPKLHGGNQIFQPSEIFCSPSITWQQINLRASLLQCRFTEKSIRTASLAAERTSDTGGTDFHRGTEFRTTPARRQLKPLSVNMSAESPMLLPNSQKSEDVHLLQNKNSSIEVQRILSILENCISKIETAAVLPALLQLNSVSGIGDTDLRKILQEHQLLVEKLEKLEGLKQESDGEQERDAEEAGEKARAQLEHDLKNSVRDLLRYFRAHPDGIIGLRAELDMKVEENEYKLIKGLKMFHSHMVEKLLISPDKELQQIPNQESSSSAHKLEKKISLEEEEVAGAMKKVDAEMSQKENKIKHLESLLQACSAQEGNMSEANMSPFEDKQVQAHIKVSKLKQDSLQQEINQLKTQLRNMMLENRQAERLLQEKNEKLQAEVDSLIQRFDDEMENIQAKMQADESAFEMEERELKMLEKPFADLEMECSQIQERRQLAEEKRREEMRVLELKTKAAIVVQARWRGYSVRKALKNKGKSKKAKKGKGKKTK